MQPLPILRFALVSLSMLLLAGCQSLQTSDNFLGVVTPYRLEIVQGNVITREQAEAVKVGMSRAQVKDVLGSPLVADPFHADRWDYVFTIRRQGSEPQLRRVAAFFGNDVLARVETNGDLPGEKEFVAAIDSNRTRRDAPVLALTDEQIQALPVPAAPAPVAASSAPPARSYPPLEPRS